MTEQDEAPVMVVLVNRCPVPKPGIKTALFSITRRRVPWHLLFCTREVKEYELKIENIKSASGFLYRFFLLKTHLAQS